MRTFALRLSTAIALCLFSALCAYFGLADFYYQRAKDQYTQLNLSQLSLAKQLNPVVIDVDRALSVRSSHADALDLKADLLYQSWWLSPDGQYLHQSNYLKEAAKLHFRSLNIRKNWSFSTSRLALIYSHQTELDEQFDYWYSKSHRLGLYETSIARSLMQLGLQNWQRLTVDQRSKTMDFVRVSIEQKVNSPQSMAKLLNHYQKREYACRELPDSPRKNRVCASL